MHTRLSHSRQKRWVRWGAIFVLIMVLLPNLAYVGHWSPFGSTTHAHSLHTERQESDHAAHCHEGPSTCTGGHATVGTWWIGDDPNPISPDAPRPSLQSDHNANAVEAPSNRILRPPRFA
jgi:hypothetical protein